MTARVVAVASDTAHNFAKPPRDFISLIAGQGVENDAHCGKTVQHLSDKQKNPNAPNLRQVHLMHSELFQELAAQGIQVSAGQMGENITTEGLDILNLPLGTVLKIGSKAEIEITGLRSPCRKLNTIDPGLLKAVVKKHAGGASVQSGIMSIVRTGGQIAPGDAIQVIYPKGAQIPLQPL